MGKKVVNCTYDTCIHNCIMRCMKYEITISDHCLDYEEK